jgi:hypothetical protein
MPEPRRRLILANGEKYVTHEVKKSRGRPPEMPRSYAEARDVVKREVWTALEKVAALPASKKLEGEVVLCLRLHPDMMAKTYDPRGIFETVRDLENVGSRNYRVAAADVAQTQRIKKQVEQHILEATGRLVFVRSNDAGFRRLLRALDTSEQQLLSEFREDVQRIEKFNLLDVTEQLLGFDADWKEGRVEVVLHPSRRAEGEQMHFLKTLFRDHDVPWAKSRITMYPEGPTFISCRLTRAALSAIAEANPLRSAHPLVFGGLEDLRDAKTFPAPQPPVTTKRSTIKVGMFDGGVDPDHALLRGHCEQDQGLSIKAPPSADYVAHGTAVAGVLLHGPLNGKDSKAALPAPPVFVVSIRALPTSDPKDIDLYEAIDVIEAAVPARPDVKAFNVSFGPRGSMLDDAISRFTYALDTLALTHKVTFCVAAGNDGDAGPGYDRIQVPADLVNGLGVGAYTRRKNVNVHAPYSCMGPGRECAKLKPDLAAFGGCEQEPTHLVSAAPGLKVLSYGTSFASPIVAALAAQAGEGFERSTPLLAHALLVHTTDHPNGEPDYLLGHGLVRSTIADVVRTGDNHVTIIFQGDILPTKMVRLPIMLPPNLVTQGKVAVTWTVAALPAVSSNHPSDYTSCCIEDTFYPNRRVFTFSMKSKGGKQTSKKLHLDDDVAEAGQLAADGWKRSEFPVSESGNRYPTEQDRRALEYKWEPMVRRHISKLAGSLHEPFLILHAIPRNGATARLDYAAVVTISASNYSGDLHDAVLRRFTALQPIRLRSEAEIRVQI